MEPGGPLWADGDGAKLQAELDVSVDGIVSWLLQGAGTSSAIAVWFLPVVHAQDRRLSWKSSPSLAAWERAISLLHMQV